MANRRHGFGGGGRSYYNSGPVNPWQVGNAPGNQGGGHYNNGNQSNLPFLSEPQAQLALAITKLLQPQQQVPSLLTMNTVNPLQNSGGYGPNNNYPHRGRGNMNRRPRPDMKPYNKMNNRNNRDTDRRRANSNKKSQPQQRNTVVSKTKKSSSTKASSKSPGKTTEVKKTPTVKEEKDEKSADTTETAVKETDDKSEDVESSDKKRDWKEEKNENDESEEAEGKKESTEKTENAETEKPDEESNETKSGRYDGIPKELFHCHICQKKMWDSESFEKHMNGRAHMQMFEKVEESYRVKADMMRETIRLSEEKHNIEMDRMKRLGKKTKTQQLSRCAMCDLDFYGQLFVHRKSPNHQKLKHFLHPRCSYCNKEFPTRMEWENHRHSAEHLRKKSENVDKKKTKPGAGDAGTDDEGILIEDEFFIVLDSTEGEEHEEPNAIIDLTEDISTIPEINLPCYKPNRAVGMSLISPVSGYFCKSCTRFFHTEEASKQHAQSKAHFKAFLNLLNEKVTEQEEKKRKAEEDDDEGNWKRRKTSKEDDEKDESKVDETAEDETMEDDKDKTENGDEFYDPSDTFNTTDPNDVCLDDSKNDSSLMNDEVWSEVDNKIDEIIEQTKADSEAEAEPEAAKKPASTPAKAAGRGRPQRAIRGRRN